MKKRILALFLAAVMLCTMLPSAPVYAAAGPRRDTPKSEDNPFTDVPSTAYYYNAVLWAVGHEPQITAGTSASTFSPGSACTRAQVVTFLWRSAGQPEPTSSNNPFTDVSPTGYYYKAVLWAVEKGITSGTSKTTFSPNGKCTRAQIATFLWRFEGQPAPKAGSENPFTDVPATAYYYNAVLWAVEQGITAGTGKNSFSPSSVCTRAQVVTFLYRDDASQEPSETPVNPDPPADDYVSELDANGNYVRGDDERIYNANLSRFDSLMQQADAVSDEARLILQAQAEAELLDSAVMLPTTTQGGGYVMSHAAPHTTPHVLWGSDDDRLHSVVLSDEFLTREEYAELEEQWAKALHGSGVYDPAAYLTGKGHTLQWEYKTTYSTELRTLDWMATSAQGDMEVLVQTVDGLMEYDNMGVLQPKLAESYEVSADGMTYTFHLRKGVQWYTSEGKAYAELTAEDFVAGLQHVLDACAGLETLLGSGGANIAGVDQYLYNDGSFADVGVKAVDKYTLQYTTTRKVPYFMTMLSYSIFLPICKSFYESRGGVFGMSEYHDAQFEDTYTYGQPGDLSSQVYCGPFLLKTVQPGEEIRCGKNPGYYDASKVTLDLIVWFNTVNDDPTSAYEKAVSGDYVSVGLSEATGLLDKAKKDGNFEKYAHTTATSATTYFGGLNLNRGTFALESGACASPKTEQQKADTVTALNNKNFRKAVQHAFDKKTYNALSRGDELAESNLRNMLNHPELVVLERETKDASGHTFPAGTTYGELVQYYCDQSGCKVEVKDGVDGWYKPELAKQYLSEAKKQLGDQVSWPICIDVVYYSASEIQTAQANAYKSSLESVLGKENVTVNLVEAATSSDLYASGYFAASGADCNYDMFYGSGWAPDFGDPGSCLSIFLGGGSGYMTRVLGLY